MQLINCFVEITNRVEQDCLLI